MCEVAIQGRYQNFIKFIPFMFHININCEWASNLEGNIVENWEIKTNIMKRIIKIQIHLI